MTATLAILTLVLAGFMSDASAQTKPLRQGQSKWSTPLGAAKTADKRLPPCPHYGEGFYRLPGSDTCVKIDGYVRTDVTVTPGR